MTLITLSNIVTVWSAVKASRPAYMVSNGLRTIAQRSVTGQIKSAVSEAAQNTNLQTMMVDRPMTRRVLDRLKPSYLNLTFSLKFSDSLERVFTKGYTSGILPAIWQSFFTTKSLLGV